MRKRIPNLVLRTTFIAGFPGETDEQFEEMVEFAGEQNSSGSAFLLIPASRGRLPRDSPITFPRKFKKHVAPE